ncbi:MAG TPA: hypothetical protein VIM30_02850 [Candidatus Limnocylindrales bacterium]
MFGDIGEVWLEAEYDSLDAHVAAFDAVHKNDKFMKVHRAMRSHLVVGSEHDYPLVTIDLTA